MCRHIKIPKFLINRKTAKVARNENSKSLYARPSVKFQLKIWPYKKVRHLTSRWRKDAQTASKFHSPPPMTMIKPPSYSWTFKTKVMLGRAWLCIRKNRPTPELASNSFFSGSNFTAAHSMICWQMKNGKKKNACSVCKYNEEHCLSTVSNCRHGKCDRVICVFT